MRRSSTRRTSSCDWACHTAVVIRLSPRTAVSQWNAMLTPSNDVRLSAGMTQSPFDGYRESTAAISWLFEPDIGPSPFGNVIGYGRVRPADLREPKQAPAHSRYETAGRGNYSRRSGAPVA